MRVLLHTKILLEEIQSSFEDAFSRMANLTQSIARPFNVSVMTILLIFNSNFDLAHVEKFHERQEKSFQNQVSIKGLDKVTGSKYCVKIFRNGRMHVTGCKSIARALVITNEVLGNIYPGVEHTLMGVDIEMLNLDFQVVVPLDLTAVSACFQESGHTTSYNSISYPGCKIQLGFCTILCFSSGSIIITGARDVQSSRRAYEIFLDVIEKHSDKILMPERSQRRGKRKRDNQFAPLLECCGGVAFVTE